MVDKRAVLAKAQKYCAYQERCQQEVRNKLYEMGLRRNEVEETISNLIVEGFINEERFAVQYALGKFRMKQWGKLKIENALMRRAISAYCINKAMKAIDEHDYQKTLEKVLNTKLHSLAEEDPYLKNHKAATYLIRKGFEPELIWKLLKTGS